MPLASSTIMESSKSNEATYTTPASFLRARIVRESTQGGGVLAFLASRSYFKNTHPFLETEHVPLLIETLPTRERLQVSTMNNLWLSVHLPVWPPVAPFAQHEVVLFGGEALISTGLPGVEGTYHASWKILPQTNSTPDRDSIDSGPGSGKRLLSAAPSPPLLPLLLVYRPEPPSVASVADGPLSLAKGSSQDRSGKDGLKDKDAAATTKQVAGGIDVPSADIVVSAETAGAAPVPMPRPPLLVVSSLPRSSVTQSSCRDDETSSVGAIVTVAPSSAISKLFEASLAPLLATRNFWRPP